MPDLNVQSQSPDPSRSRAYEFPRPATNRCVLDLAADTAETLDVPSGHAFAAFFANGSQFWVDYDTTAVIPAGDVTDGSAPDWCPSARDVGGVSTLSIIAPADCRVQVLFW